MNGNKLKKQLILNLPYFLIGTVKSFL